MDSQGLYNNKNQGVVPNVSPTTAPPPYVITIPAPTAKKKTKKQDFTLVYLLIALAIIGAVILIGPTKVADTLVGIVQSAGLPLQEDCGVANSTRLRFAEKTYKSGDNQVTFVGPNPIPALFEQDSIVCFEVEEMQTFYNLQINWLDGKTRPGIEVLANIIIASTAKVAGKSGDGDIYWEKTLYEKLLPALDKDSFKTEGVPEGYAYLILPGYVGSATTPTPTLTVTPTEQPIIVPPNALDTPTLAPTPTPMPRPTLEAQVTKALQQLATLQVQYAVTPLPPITPLPSVGATSLEYFLGQLGPAAACSYLGLTNYDTYWPPPDSVVTVYIGPNCFDGEGIQKRVQLPADLITRHVSGYPQIWFTSNPQAYRGPASSLGNGVFIQPFTP